MEREKIEENRIVSRRRMRRVLKIEEELVVDAVEKIGDTIFSFFLFFFFPPFYVSAGIMPRDEETAQTS